MARYNYSICCNLPNRRTWKCALWYLKLISVIDASDPQAVKPELSLTDQPERINKTFFSELIVCCIYQSPQLPSQWLSTIWTPDVFLVVQWSLRSNSISLMIIFHHFSSLCLSFEGVSTYMYQSNKAQMFIAQHSFQLTIDLRSDVPQAEFIPKWMAFVVVICILKCFGFEMQYISFSYHLCFVLDQLIPLVSYLLYID